MRRRSVLSPKRAAVGGALLLSLALPGACSKTPNPQEVYIKTRPSGGSGGSGGSPAGGGSSGGTSTGNQPGAGGAGGDSDVRGGAGGQDSGGGAGPEPIDCGPTPVSGGSVSLDSLRQAAAECATWHYCRFENAAASLAYYTEHWATAPDEATLSDAREAWRDAMSVWSLIELFQFGPLASKAESAGKDIHQGQGIRELIYSWRVVSRCRIEEQLFSQGYLDGADNLLISARGLYAVEYLLFYPGADTACAPATPTGTGWSELDPGELAARKLDYAVVLSKDVLAKTQLLRQTWAPEGQDFMTTFVSASGYPDQHDAMTALGWALLYVEKELKDWKLGVRTGDIMETLVPEAPFAAALPGYELVPTENIRQNLRGFRALFQGCGEDGEGLGFDDWLSEAGHGGLAADIIAAWQGAQDAADVFPPLEQAADAELDELYQKVRALTTLLKTDLFSAASPLGLTLPPSVGSDTD